MSNVVDFGQKRLEQRPHVHGKVICAGCKHEHDAILPAGTIDAECPSCGAFKCYHKHHALFPDGHIIYVCTTCDGELFSFSPEGQALCAGCGSNHMPWSEE